MKGIRFYLDHDNPNNKRKGCHNGNVTAVLIDTGRLSWVRDHKYSYDFDALGAVFFYPNSPVALTAVSRDWLQSCAKRISEVRARTIHSELFKRLDTKPGSLPVAS